MPKTLNIQTNMTAGEISPRLLGRVDIDKYRNATESMVNCHPLVHGGCVRRAGKRRIAATKYADKLAILIPFNVSKDIAYQLEFGDLYMRVFTQAKAQVLSAPLTPFEIATPFLESEIDDLRYVQGSATMFIAHPNHPIQKLTRTADNDWKMVDAPWLLEPADEILQQPATSITLSALTGAITVTAAAASFVASDVGRQVLAGNGVATITGFTSTTIVNATVVDAFAALGFASQQWGINLSPKTTVTPSAVGPLGATITLTTAAATWQNNAQYNHIGHFVNLNGGLVEITAFTSNLIVSGVVRSILSSALAVGADGWTVDSKVWGGARGYPMAVGLYQQRLIAGGSTGYPQTLWGTKTGDYLNFAVGANDNDGFSFTINSDQINPIQHITNTKELAVFTSGGEVTLRGGAEKALSSTNVQSETQSAYGCNNVRPLRIGAEILFWTRAGRKMRAFAYQVDSDSFRSPDMTVLSEHITSPGILQMSYAQEPDSIIYALRTDGVIVKCAYDREQNVAGFARDITDGVIESVSSNPAGTSDQTWNIVARAVGGALVRSVEVDDPDTATDFCVTGSNYRTIEAFTGWAAGIASFTLTAHGFVEGETLRARGSVPATFDGDFVVHVIDANHYSVPMAADPGVSIVLGEIAFSATVWSGFAYCEGREVQLLADGSPQALQTVVAGQVTILRPAYEIEGGLPFVNYFDVLPIEQPNQFGTAQGSQISVSRIVVRCYNTAGVSINDVQVPTRAFGQAVLDMPVELVTGDIDLSSVGWDQSIGGRVRIGQNLPLPWQILAVIREVTVNN